MVIYTDGSFNWRKNLYLKEKKGKIAFKLGEKGVEIKEIKIKEIPGLKQYANLLELIAVLEALKKTRAKRVFLLTDSQVIKGWIKSKKNLSEFSLKHQEVQEEIKEKLRKLKNFNINWISRDFNLAGKVFE